MAFRTIPTKPSSNIAPGGVTYEDDSKTLRIAFLSGRTYEYQDIDGNTADGFSRAESPGRYFNAFVRDVSFGEEV